MTQQQILKAATDLRNRITEYLGVGGMFNPELMDHQAVRDLLVECRTVVLALLESVAR